MDRVWSAHRLFSRNQAITAMVLAERLAAGYGDDDLFVMALAVFVAWVASGRTPSGWPITFT